MDEEGERASWLLLSAPSRAASYATVAAHVGIRRRKSRPLCLVCARVLSLPPCFSSPMFSSSFVSWTPILELILFSSSCSPASASFYFMCFDKESRPREATQSCASGSRVNERGVGLLCCCHFKSGTNWFLRNWTLDPCQKPCTHTQRQRHKESVFSLLGHQQQLLTLACGNSMLQKWPFFFPYPLPYLDIKNLRIKHFTSCNISKCPYGTSDIERETNLFYFFQCVFGIFVSFQKQIESFCLSNFRHMFTCNFI
jgi:hypothetical protein